MQPLIFSSHSIASERHPQRNEDSFVLDQESGLAGVFDGAGVPVPAKISASQRAAQVILLLTLQAFTTFFTPFTET